MEPIVYEKQAIAKCAESVQSILMNGHLITMISNNNNRIILKWYDGRERWVQTFGYESEV